MSTIDLHELPLAEDAGEGRTATVDIPAVNASRRDVIGYTVKGATFLGLVGLGFFRSARRAGAENPPWTENKAVALGCGAYNIPGEQVCGDDLCVGTSAENISGIFCTSCADADATNWAYWHKNRVDDSGFEWRDYPGHICAPDNSGAYDAWWWQLSTCNNCSPASYRCHDGQKRDDATQSWRLTICQGLASCAGAPVGCP